MDWYFKPTQTGIHSDEELVGPKTATEIFKKEKGPNLSFWASMGIDLSVLSRFIDNGNPVACEQHCLDQHLNVCKDKGHFFSNERYHQLICYKCGASHGYVADPDERR